MVYKSWFLDRLPNYREYLGGGTETDMEAWGIAQLGGCLPGMLEASNFALFIA